MRDVRVHGEELVEKCLEKLERRLVRLFLIVEVEVENACGVSASRTDFH